ncbi:ABC transporter permease [Nocardiopsis metallicus]|uniref:Transport permease protein n=1 Tax=Nocardiopsis metallicus TaxID=179819 RepID=A0A840W7C4_9ACTN|nr:ABC transporter permease [Nocardiopsis metallicus]MBB5492909.1 ABC-2 type transport system permease protein [Nocardiopsis metallicus]
MSPPARTASVAVPPRAPVAHMVLAICASEMRAAGRDRLLMVFTLLTPLLIMLLFAQLPDMFDHDPAHGGLRAVDAVMAPVALGVALMAISLVIVPTTLAAAREHRYLRRISATPAPPGALLLAHTLVGAVNMVGACAVILGVGWLVYDLRMPVAPGWFVLGLLLAAMALLALSALIGGLVPNATWANALGAVVLVPGMFLSGVLFPAEDMPASLQRVTDVLPSGAALHVLREAWTGQPPQPLHLLVLVATTVLLWPLAIRFFRWS